MKTDENIQRYTAWEILNKVVEYAGEEIESIYLVSDDSPYYKKIEIFSTEKPHNEIKQILVLPTSDIGTFEYGTGWSEKYKYEECDLKERVDFNIVAWTKNYVFTQEYDECWGNIFTIIPLNIEIMERDIAKNTKETN